MTGMLKAVAAVLAVLPLLAAGCFSSSTRAFEGEACSPTSGGSSYARCDRTFANLICITTDKVKTTDAYVCRVACTQNSDCANSGGVCCKGPVIENIYGATRGCTP